MTATTAPRYQARGTTDEVTTCGFCGREDLKGTVILAIITTDGDTDGTVHAGSDCAARLSGRPVKDITREAKAADEKARTATRQAAYAASSDATARFHAWITETYGTRPGDLNAAEQATGKTTYQLRKQWKAAA